MNYFEMINQIIEYIEIHLKEELNLKELAQKASLSPYHFHRIFTTTTGYSPMEYIRKRRIYFAFQEIRNSKKSILEIALELGYSSNETFTRAFFKECGSKPSEIRNYQRKQFTEKISHTQSNLQR